MAEKALWLLAGIGVGVGVATAAWWLSQQQSGTLSGPEPLVRQHVVNRNDQGLIESVETSTFPAVGSGVGGEADLEVVRDG